MAYKKTMKAAAGTTKAANKGVRTRCEQVKKAISHAEGCSTRVKHMLCNTISLTIGTNKADRHPFNERFVAMIQQVMEAEQKRQNQAIAAQEAAFAELAPAKATREAALEQAKATAAAKNEALDNANKEVSAAASAVKAAKGALKASKQTQKTDDAEIEGLIGKRGELDNVRTSHLAPAVSGGEEDKEKHVNAVLKAGASFSFDSALMDTAKQVLLRSAAERGAFDSTCLEQLQGAFASGIAKFDEEIAALAPGKAERQSAVDHCQAGLQAAEASHAGLKEKAGAARDAKAAADGEKKAAASSLDDFMPDLKNAGDGLDGAKRSLQEFQEGPATAFGELRELKEGDFVPVKKVKVVEAEPEAHVAPEAGVQA